MTLFRGQFRHSLDSKGRVHVPARFRELKGEIKDPLGTGPLYVTRALFDRCLHVHPSSHFEELEAKVSEYPLMDPHIVQFRRRYLSAAVECELDATGRLLVPQQLRELGGFERELLWVGMGRHIELWAPCEWERALAMTPEQESEFKKAILEQFKI